MENTVIVTETGITVRVIPQVVNVTATVGSATGTGGGGGVTDHGDLTGLADDDHTQYLNNARGDVRYAPIAHSHVIADVTGLQTAIDGKAASSHTHIIGDVTGLQTALDGKAATSHTHVISDVTGLQTALDGKAAVSHTHVIADVTGLQTALDGKAAISHSHVRADITDFAHTHPQSDITNLTTDLAGKQATLVSGTNIRTVNGNSLLGSGDLVTPSTNDTRELMKAMGLSIITESMGRSRSDVTTTFTLTDGLILFAAALVPVGVTITGVGYYQGVAGVYTGDNENRFGLYTFSGGTYTRVALTANNTELWKGTAQEERRVALTSTYVTTTSVIYIASIYNNSAQTTAPNIGMYATLANAAVSGSGFSGIGRLCGFISGQTTLASSYSEATVQNTNNQPYFFLY
jgi:hypothetical protein